MASPMLISPEQIMQEKDDLARKGIRLGREVVALEYEHGFVLVAENASSTLHKISEIYDRIAFAGVGNYQEYNPLRTAGIEQAEVKGYTYSREDVTARWLANLYSQAIGNVWRQFDTKPLEIELLIAEVGEPGYSSNGLYRISYNGQLQDDRGLSVIGGRADEIRTWLEERFEEALPLDRCVRLAVEALDAVEDDGESDSESLTSGRLEVAVLDESRGRRKFCQIPRDAIAKLLNESSEEPR
jgi:proteasome alpha subunit